MTYTHLYDYFDNMYKYTILTTVANTLTHTLTTSCKCIIYPRESLKTLHLQYIYSLGMVVKLSTHLIIHNITCKTIIHNN